MKDTNEVLKISEVRSLLKDHNPESLHLIAEGLYKILTKQQKLDNNVVELIQNPRKSTQQKSTEIKGASASFATLKAEILFFEEHAYAQDYLIPNRYISKAERPKWRFHVNRFYKALLEFSKHPEYQKDSAELLVKLYKVMTYACHYVLFSGYDVFDSIRIPQHSFFTSVLNALDQTSEKKTLVTQGVHLVTDNSLNRYTLYTDLMKILLEHLHTADMKQYLIEYCIGLRNEHLNKPHDKKSAYRTDYQYTEKLNNLTEFIFHAWMELGETDNAISDFRKYNQESSEEINLYVLIRLLFGYKALEPIRGQLDLPSTNKLAIRKGLCDLKVFIARHNSLPEYL